jgi:hypothetical protein
VEPLTQRLRKGIRTISETLNVGAMLPLDEGEK